METLLGEYGKYSVETSPGISAANFSSNEIPKLHVSGGRSRFSQTVMSTMQKKVKFICSSSGKILPRPSDMKLRYVGGETRMVSLPRHVNYEGFYGKLVELYGPDVLLKYQLPEEDLDALVSVSSDEDLENMMEECDRLSVSEGSPKLRAFIFLASDLDVQGLDEIAAFKSSERNFVDAINGLPAGDTFSGLHGTAKMYRTSDSFNDAYKAWNGIQSQEQDSFFSKNPYSEVHPLEVSPSSGNLHTYESFVPDQLQSSTSPFSHSAFMRQPMPALGVPDAFTNDISSTDWKDSSSFFAQGIDQSYVGSHWITSSEMSVPTQFTNDDRKEARTYEIEQTGESYKADHGNVLDYLHVQNTDDSCRLDKASVFDNALPTFRINATFSGLEAADVSKHSGGLGHIGHRVSSPDALLQKELMDMPSTVAPSQKYFFPDWSSEDLSHSVDRQLYSISSRLENQPETCNNHVPLEQWENPPIYDSSFKAGDQNHVFQNIDEQPVGLQLSSAAADILPISTKSSPAKFLANIAPSSLSSWNLQFEKNYLNVLSEQDNRVASMTVIPSQDSRASVVSSVQGSANIASVKPIKEIAQIGVVSMPGQSLTEDTGNSNLISVIEKPHSNVQGLNQEALMKDRARFKDSSNLSGGTSLFFGSSNGISRTISVQSDQHNDQFPEVVKTEQSVGPLLTTESFLPSRRKTVAICQHDTDRVDEFSNLEDVSPTAMLDGSQRLDILSELLGSTRLTEFLAETSSTGGSLRSKSSVDEELRGDEGEKTKTVAGEEQLLAGNESMDLQLPVQEIFSRFQTTQNSLPSNEQFDELLGSSLPTKFDDGNKVHANVSPVGNIETISNPQPSQIPALTSLIESWEATLLQDEDEQKREHVMHEHVHKRIDLSPTFDKEIEPKDTGNEFEDVEEFWPFNYKPMNAASIAEQEAISRGLQIIRNCDLEELHELGSGTFGTVYHGKWRGSDVAIKRIKSSCFAGRQAERDRLVADFWREVCILGQLHHPNVVAFYGVVPDGPGGTLATVTEYMVNGSLKQVLQNKDRTLDRRKRLLIAMDAAFGMEYLHGKNVVHFDIKCENLLVNLRDTQRPICKVGDLGLSKVKQQTFVSGGVRGTLPWMAPELLNGSSSLVSEKVDVFSFGIVMWELLTEEEPYANMHYGAIIGGIVNNTLRPPVPRWCDPAWRSLMERCWAADPNERPNFREIARALRAMEASLVAKGPGPARILKMYH